MAADRRGRLFASLVSLRVVSRCQAQAVSAGPWGCVSVSPTIQLVCRRLCARDRSPRTRHQQTTTRTCVNVKTIPQRQNGHPPKRMAASGRTWPDCSHVRKKRTKKRSGRSDRLPLVRQLCHRKVEGLADAPSLWDTRDLLDGASTTRHTNRLAIPAVRLDA